MANVDYFDAGDSGPAILVDWSNGACQRVNLTGSCTIAFNKGYQGTFCILHLVQDAIGLRLVTWPANLKWVSPPVLSTLGGKRDIIGLSYDGSTWWAWPIGIGFKEG